MRKGVLTDTAVIANCPIYQPVPMKYVSNVLKHNHEQIKSNFTGIKHVKRSIPPRPMNINALAVALSNISEKNLTQTRTAILNELPADAFRNVPGQSAEEFINGTPARRMGQHRAQGTPIARRTRSNSIAESDEIGALAGQVHISPGVERHMNNFMNLIQLNQNVNSYFPEI